MPNLPEHQKSAVWEFFEDVKLITGFLGYTFFTPKRTNEKLENLLYCTRSGTKASGIFADGVFTVLKGSLVRNANNELVTLTEDRTFKSPSGASRFVINNSSNGWTDWRNKGNESLDDLFRRGRANLGTLEKS